MNYTNCPQYKECPDNYKDIMTYCDTSCKQGRWMKPQQACTCDSEVLTDHLIDGCQLTDYMCPLHKAAPAMYEALKGIVVDLENIVAPYILEATKEALLKAEGKSK